MQLFKQKLAHFEDRQLIELNDTNKFRLTDNGILYADTLLEETC